MNDPHPAMHGKAFAALERLQGDAYAQQQARGFRLLRFIPPLEKEYLAHMRADQRISALVCTVTALIIWLIFIGLDLVRLAPASGLVPGAGNVWGIAALRFTTLVLLATLVWSLFHERLPDKYHWLSFLSLSLIGATAAFSASVYKLHGLPQADLAQFAIIVAAFLPIGMTFYQASLAALIVAGSTMLIGLGTLDGPQMTENLRLSVVLFLTAFVGAVGAYLREHAQRDQFLLRRQLHYHAMADALTAIGNRRFFEQNATLALRQAAREDAGAVLAILDIDHFKRFNDRYGHHAGDLALRLVAQALKGCLRRPMDLAARLGGEEFGLLFYGAGPEQAQALLDNVVRAIAELAIPHDTSETARHLTVSIGAACFDGRETLENLYRRADAALYGSKGTGRNRVELDWRLADERAAVQSSRNG